MFKGVLHVFLVLTRPLAEADSFPRSDGRLVKPTRQKRLRRTRPPPPLASLSSAVKGLILRGARPSNLFQLAKEETIDTLAPNSKGGLDCDTIFFAHPGCPCFPR